MTIELRIIRHFNDVMKSIATLWLVWENDHNLQQHLDCLRAASFSIDIEHFRSNSACIGRLRAVTLELNSVVACFNRLFAIC